jgi:hypothetical protein
VAARGAGAAARPRAAHRRAHRGNEDIPLAKPLVSALTQTLADLGWTDGRNVRTDLRWTGDDINRIRVLAQELVGLQPDIIVVTGSTATTAALQRETRTIPIVFANVADPIATGIVTRLDRPSGNITGFAALEASLGGKWLELLSEIAPGLKRAAIMFNPDIAFGPLLPSFEAAARSLKVGAITAPVHNDAEIETAIIALGDGMVRGLLFESAKVLLSRSARCGQSSDDDDPHRVRRRSRPGQAWACYQPRPARQQCDRYQFFQPGGGRQAAGTPA